jgi:hypothetical protein
MAFNLVQMIKNSSSMLHQLRAFKSRQIKDYEKALSTSGWDLDFVLSASKLIDLIRSSALSKTNAFHIIGSSSSVLDSVTSINTEKEYVAGFNSAVLIDDLFFDFYFIEGICRMPKTGEDRFDIDYYKIVINSLLNKRYNLLVFKNLWEGNIDYNFILASYPGIEPYLLREVLLPTGYKDLESIHTWYTVRELVRIQNDYFTQSGTTAFLLIVIAVYCGFKTIVLHGVDLGGTHFYNEEDFVWPSSIDPQTIYKLKSQSSSGGFASEKGKSRNSYGQSLYNGLIALAVWASTKKATIYAGSSKSLLLADFPQWVPANECL